MFNQVTISACASCPNIVPINTNIAGAQTGVSTITYSSNAASN